MSAIREAIRDVIVSGGDPLTLPVAKLRWFVTELAAIDHVDVIRIGTRVPVTLPQRLFDTNWSICWPRPARSGFKRISTIRSKSRPKPTRACRNLVNAGMPVNNHAVLMKGVNDSVPDHAGTDPRAAADQGPALLSVPLRSGDRGGPFPHLGLEGHGDHRRPARATSRAWAFRRMWSTACMGRARFRSCPTT